MEEPSKSVAYSWRQRKLPSGATLTRIGHPGAENHDHHRSVWFAHHKVNGLDFWSSAGMVITPKTRALRPIFLGLLIVWFLPNTQQFMRRYFPALGMKDLPDATIGPRRRWQWRPTYLFLAFILILLYAVGRDFDRIGEFIYFQF